MSSSKGKLYLVPAPLDFMCSTQTALHQVMPEGTLQVASHIDHWVCENAKSTRALLKRLAEVHPLKTVLQEQQITELPRQIHKKGDHVAAMDTSGLLAPALQGHDMGLVSEAGMPAVADPGSSLVRAAHDAGIQVIPLVGPCSLLLALAASGLNGQQFAFIGYLPQDAALRLQRIQALEKHAMKTGETQIFIETPYRNESLMRSMLEVLHPQTRLALACGLSGPNQWIQSHLIEKWKTFKTLPPLQEPCVFLLGA